MKLDFELLQAFFQEDCSPKDLAKLLDEFLFDYMLLLAREKDRQEERIHENATEYIYYFKQLRDVLMKCEK